MSNFSSLENQSIWGIFWVEILFFTLYDDFDQKPMKISADSLWKFQPTAYGDFGRRPMAISADSLW